MKATLDPTKLPGYRHEWSISTEPRTEEEAKENRAVPKVISPRLARKISAAYCCAACWSGLTISWNGLSGSESQYTLECEYCGGDVPGFVTRTYISYRIRENEEEYRQARMAMENAYPFLFPKRELRIRATRTEEQNLKELGF